MLVRRYSTLFTMLMSIFLPMTLSAMDIRVTDAYVRETIPGTSNSVAYLKIDNETNQEVTLISVRSNDIPKVKIHTHAHQNGVMAMRPVKEVVIPAQSSFLFRPGGHHLMLMGLQKPLMSGQVVQLKLLFKDGSAIDITAPVQSIAVEFE